MHDYAQFIDIDNIRCKEESYSSGEELHNHVFGMDFEEECGSMYIHPLDYVIVALILALILGCIDFIYNYCQYKKYRKLPWIVRFKCC